MFRFIRGYRKEAVLAPLFKMSEALLELLVPLVVKNIIPERMKIKLVIVDHYEAAPEKREEKYFFTGEHMNSFRYSPECCPRNTETVF